MVKKPPTCGLPPGLTSLPECNWIHPVFTLPASLWPLFEVNRWLLNDLCRLAVDNLLYAASRRGLDSGIFWAIHTYGQRLNWHPHIHVSVTCGGIDAHGKWKKSVSVRMPCAPVGCGISASYS
ncbi:transposase [Erwinia tracheiphila PSU-1]|nr:transposase [Erwinia tracheiphila PSU-1]